MRRLLSFLLVAAQVSWGAVAFNNAGSITNVTATSFSGAMSVTAAGSNRCALAMIGFDRSGVGVPQPDITAVTYNSVSMNAGGTSAFNATSNSGATIYTLANPATGSNTLAVTGNSEVQEIYVNLVSVTGCHQTTPVRPSSFVTATGTSTAPAVTVSTSSANDITFSALDSGGSGITSTNQTSDGIDNGGTDAGASDHCTTPASSVTHTWLTGSTSWAIAGLSIQPPAGGATVKMIPLVAALDRLYQFLSHPIPYPQSVRVVRVQAIHFHGSKGQVSISL